VQPADIVGFFDGKGFGEFLPAWSPEDVAAVTEDGKIPRLQRWTERLEQGQVGLDALLNISGLQSFASDQELMDRRIREMV
jgi:transaldolase